MGFELTLMCFLPMFTGGSLVVEALVKYFLVQVGGSSLFAISFLLPFPLLCELFFLLGMVIKLGLFPFYRWVPMVMTSVSWVGCLFVVTFQKVAPLLVMCENYFIDSTLLLFLRVRGVLVRGFLGFNQSYIRSLIAYSSVRHTSWLVISLMFRFRLFVLYLLIYFFLVFVLFFVFSRLALIKVVPRGMGLSSWVVVVFFMFSLSGLPPFSMFYLKVGVLLYLVDFYFFVPFLLVGSLLSIYYYLTFIVGSLPSV